MTLKSCLFVKNVNIFNIGYEQRASWAACCDVSPSQSE